jgi:hypothetical protein
MGNKVAMGKGLNVKVVCVLVCIESFVDELSSNDLIEMMRLRRNDKGGFIHKGFVFWCKWGLGMFNLKKYESQKQIKDS